jgi:tight adherence protein G
MKNYFHLLKNRRRSEKGATMILVAIAMSILIPSAGAMSIDLGIIATTNRSLQSIADGGALNAANYLTVNPSYVTTAAENSAADNGWSSAVTGSNVIQGNSLSGGNVTAGTCPCTYVQVTAASTMHDLFLYGSQSLSRTAIAQVTPSNANFSIGTYLANFNSGQSSALNSLFTQLGTTVNITAAGYDGLADSNITIQQLLTASNSVLSPTNTLNASDVLSTRVTDAQWVSIINKALTTASGSLPPSCTGSNDPCLPFSNLTSWVSGLSPTSTLPTAGSCTSITNPCLSQLLSVDGTTSSSGTLTVGELAASVNMLQMLTTEAETADGQNGISISSALGLSTLLGPLLSALLGNVATLSVKVIQPPQVASGGVGTSASTSQTQIALDLLGVNITATAVQGTATFTSMSCTNFAPNSATFNITDTLVGAANLAVTGAPNGASLTVNSPFPNSGTTSVGSLSLSLGALSGLTSGIISSLTSGVLNIFQALGISIAGNNVTVASATCGSVSLVR